MRNQEDLTIPVFVNVYVNAYGEHPIPHNVMKGALEVNGGKSVFDKRTRGYRTLRKWMLEVDAKSEAGWVNA